MVASASRIATIFQCSENLTTANIYTSGHNNSLLHFADGVHYPATFINPAKQFFWQGSENQLGHKEGPYERGFL